MNIRKRPISPLAAIAGGLLAGAIGTVSMDTVRYLKYRRAGGEDSPLAWEFGPIDSWEKAPDPGQVTKRLKRIPAPDVALSQHLLPGIAGTVGTHSGPFMSAEDGIQVTVYGQGSHGALPQNSIDPVVLAAMIIVRLQTIVSREVTPGEIAILTVGSVQAGTRGNVIPDHAVLQLNMRSYSQPTRQRMLAAIQRIVRAECQASGSPKDPDFETVASFPFLDNDAATTARVAAAFAAHFGDNALELPRQTVSEDFGIIPDAAGIPYTYWGIGRTDRQAYLAAEKDGRLQDLPANHSPKFLPPLHPTMRTGTEALITAALSWLAPQ